MKILYFCCLSSCLLTLFSHVSSDIRENFLRLLRQDFIFICSGTPDGYGGHKELPKENDTVVIATDWWMLIDEKTEVIKLDQLHIFGTLEIDGDNDVNHVIQANIIFIAGPLGQLIVGWPDKPYPNTLLMQLTGDHNSKDMPITSSLNLGSKAIGVFGNMQLYGKPVPTVWTTLAETLDVGGKILKLEESVGWKAGDELVVTTTSFESKQTEKFLIESVSEDGKTITLTEAAAHRHVASSLRAGAWKFSLSAKVGLLTRNIVIEGVDTPTNSLEGQSFGCRVLVGNSPNGKGRAEIAHVEFKHCGQYGWTEDYDPRYI